MITKFLEGIRNCSTSDGRFIQLEYFLLEREGKELSNTKKSYGIEIVKKCDHLGQIVYTETDYIDYITYEKEKAKQIINKLIANSVTPVTMSYVIDDLMDETPCA
ncbi:DUF6514 family protein [Defluviitalea phaphyphila]|uniref:DUF6514 family protein n=1 Tax=Defluviitalea phaphyphila TaxID=1473580 RepID=UPI0007311863|nr:DUF6514 family protein [Defluviitalea phaphyphila]